MQQNNPIEELLNDRSYYIEYSKYATNHAKHAVIALAGLGADTEIIKAYHKAYITKTDLISEATKPSINSITENNWKDYFGHRTSYASYYNFFDQQEKELGRDQLLKKYLPELLPGWAGSLAHATIHLGWGLSVNNRCMMIEGLAYMAYSFISCQPECLFKKQSSNEKFVIDSILNIAEKWDNNFEELHNWAESLISDKTSAAAQKIHPDLKNSLQYRIVKVLNEGHPIIYEEPLWIMQQKISLSWEQLYYTMTIVYLSQPGDFIILHLLTSLYAMEKIANELPIEQQLFAIKNYWVGMLCILFSKANFPKRMDLENLHKKYENLYDSKWENLEKTEWTEIIARAFKENEEHNPKLVYIMQYLWKRTGYLSIYRVAAASFIS
ncbi:questin oxidase family protein [Fluviispira vulneris]|uniref:questin oxidase family protein n=1 Tax=Fluviispira vulneris TaxID=2763012 RepID=UPI00164478D4|nr:questin oxidase family protein [Fluviispira vulneris]